MNKNIDHHCVGLEKLNAQFCTLVQLCYFSKLSSAKDAKGSPTEDLKNGKESVYCFSNKTISLILHIYLHYLSQ